MNKQCYLILCKILFSLMCILTLWGISHLWNEQVCSQRYFSDQEAIGSYYQETIWRLKNLALESISMLSLLRSQQVQLERMRQDVELLRDPLSQEKLQLRQQDCYTCGTAANWNSNSEFIPHLSPSSMNMTPLRRIGQGRSGYKLVFGIPTVERSEEYLFQTLSSLLDPWELADLRQALFIVFIAESDNSSYCQYIIDQVTLRHGRELKTGVLEVVCPNPSSYPPLGHLPQTLSDPEDRVHWRAKQVLDFSFLMWYAAPKGDYYIQLEDDLTAVRGYLQHIQSYLDSYNDSSWLFIHFSLLGFIGKLFRSADLVPFIEYMLLFYYRQPVDWLLSNYHHDMVCFHSQLEHDCKAQIATTAPYFSPSLFQHIGTTSSLRGKIQDLVDAGYNNYVSNSAEGNPPAILTSSLQIYESYIFSKVYLGQGDLWANRIQIHDFIQISFFNSQALFSIKVVTGGRTGRNDKLISGQIEYANEGSEEYVFLCLFVKGLASCEFPVGRYISGVRVLVAEAQSQWLIISELTIKPL